MFDEMTEVPPIRVMVIDAHPLFRAGLVEAIASQPDMTISGEAATGREAVQRFLEQAPDVTLMDIDMPGMCGVKAMQEIRRHAPEARFIMLTALKGDVKIPRAAHAGATGFLLKSTMHTELLDTIRDVHAGRRRMPMEILQELSQYVGHDPLSGRETEVLQHAAAGNSNRGIALKMSLSEETVKSHMKSILSKLLANDRTHAVTIALKRGIIRL